MQERIPPQNIEAEQAVLGAMLIDKEAVTIVADKLQAGDFYREAHKVIYDAMMELHNKQQPVDLLTVTDALKKLNKLDDIGGIAYLTSLANVVPTAANVGYHADIVEEISTLRQLIAGGTQIAIMGFEGVGEVEEIIGQAESTILSIANRKQEKDFVLMQESMAGVIHKIEQLADNKGDLTG